MLVVDKIMALMSVREIKSVLVKVRVVLDLADGLPPPPCLYLSFQAVFRRRSARHEGFAPACEDKCAT